MALQEVVIYLKCLYECFVICVMSAVGTKFSVMILLKIFLECKDY